MRAFVLLRRGGGSVVPHRSDRFCFSAAMLFDKNIPLQQKRRTAHSITTTGHPRYFGSVLGSNNHNGWWRSESHSNSRCSSRCFSSVSSQVQRLGLSSHKWSRIEATQYETVIDTALRNGITTIEAGQASGANSMDSHQALLNAIQKSSHSNIDNPLTVLVRIGYRSSLELLLKHDVVVEQPQAQQPQAQPQPDGSTATTTPQVVHNISDEYIQAYLDASPLAQHFCNNNEQQTKQTMIQNLVGMIHNPEAQIVETIKTNVMDYDQRQAYMKETLYKSFGAMERFVRKGCLSSFGIVSNGLCLPKEHPLHLSWKDAVVPALDRYCYDNDNNQNNFSAIQLPVNLLETNGVALAREIRDYGSDIQVIAMRPLTCYPDRGTGTGHPFQLVDYCLPAGGTGSANNATIWSHEAERPPLVYSNALKEAMSHFDAEDILQELYDGGKEEGGGGNSATQQLSMEQRETLDGCKLLQSMLHDLDRNLETIRSVKVHEEELLTKIIPLIQDTFEEYDETTADVLQRFFAAYGLAVKHSVARNTRRALLSGDGQPQPQAPPSDAADSSSNVVVEPPQSCYYDIPPETKLQEYALQFLLQNEAISKIMIGCTRPEHVLENIQTVAQQDDGGGGDDDNEEETKKGE